MHIPTLSHVPTAILALLTTTHALTINSPTTGSTLDPTQPITLQWTSTPSDPSTFTLVLDNSASGGLVDNLVVANDVSTSSGTYALPAGTARTYGQGFVLMAEGSDGDVLARSGSFALAMGAESSSGITSTGTSTTTSSSSADSGPFSFGSASGSITTTNTATTSSGGNSFTTSTISRSGSGSGSSTIMSSTTSPTATTSQNAQPKLELGGGRGSIVFTAAGIVAGLAALFA